MAKIVRKSAFQGVHPLQPRKADTQPVQNPASPSEPEITAQPQASTSHKAKYTLYLDSDVMSRARGVFEVSRVEEGFQSYSDMITIALRKYVEDLEFRYTHGLPHRIGTNRGLRGRPATQSQDGF
jgi:hypothetical protein